MVPYTTDGRVLFAVPWHDVVVVGTTDTPLNERSNDPVAKEQEIDFILENAGHYMAKKGASRIAPEVAQIMAKYMSKDDAWIEAELSAFEKIAASYLT